MDRVVRVVAGGLVGGGGGDVGEGSLYGFKHSGEPVGVVNSLILWNLGAFIWL